MKPIWQFEDTKKLLKPCMNKSVNLASEQLFSIVYSST